MKKKWMGGLLALALAALCMLPTQVQAASTSTTEKHMHGDVECILWTDERAREQCGPNSTASNSLPYVDYGQLGIYCLTKDVYLPKDWTPYTWWGGTNSLTICLNGHTINGAGILGKDEATYNDITDQQSLTLMDCTEDASKRGSFGVYHSAGSKNSAILLKRGNNLTLSNVTLTGIDCAKAALANDIPVVLGNDVGCPWITQYDFWRELYYFHKYVGVSNTFALYTATCRGAEMAGIGDITGTLEPGKCADMIVVEKNPLEDIRALRNVDMVVSQGKVLRSPKVKKKQIVETELDKFL